MTIRATGNVPGLAIIVTDRALPASRGSGTLMALWPPMPGTHLLVLTDGRHIYDRFRLVVQ